MSNFWKLPGVPHKGWTLITVIDIREDGQPEWDTDYETCMMCGNEKIRYVHVLEHKEVDDEFRVGCVCAEKMTNDYINPRQRENELRNRSNRRKTWIKRKWKLSKNGNLYLTVDERHIVIYREKKSNKYKVKIGNVFGKKQFDSLEEAKVAAFNGVEYYRSKE